MRNFLTDATPIMESIIGSRASGFATSASDKDILRVVVAPDSAFLGLFSPRYEDFQSTEKITSDDGDPTVELETVEVSRFAQNMLKASQKVLDTLYSEDAYLHPSARAFAEVRDDLITKELWRRYMAIIGEIERNVLFHTEDDRVRARKKLRLGAHLVEQMKIMWSGGGYVICHDDETRERIAAYVDARMEAAHNPRSYLYHDMADIYYTPTALPDSMDHSAMVPRLNAIVLSIRDSLR